MTNDACITFCDKRGLPIAGTEYAGQCFCGSELPESKVGEDRCSMACTGDARGVCGGAGTLSVWSKGAGGGMAKRHVGHLGRHARKFSEY
jgi:hypothetical protein